MSTTAHHKKLSLTDWATIITLAERGEKNLRELAEMFGVTKSAIHKGLQKRGVKIASRLGEVAGEANDNARAERERQMASANAAVKQYAQFNDVLVKGMMRKYIDATAVPGGVAAINADVITIKNLLVSLRIARQENWDILDVKALLGDEAVLPDLNVGEYSPDELEEIRQVNEDTYLESLEEDDDSVFSGAEDEDDDDFVAEGLDDEGSDPTED